VRLYNLTAGKTEVEFFEEARKTGRSLRYNDEFRNRFEMIQDFEMPAQCAQVAITRDQRHIVAAGGYGPQIRIFDLAELSQKCMRGLDSEVVKFALLGTDYEKAVFACADRNL
jgi:ribosome biogenesis protein ENP2